MSIEIADFESAGLTDPEILQQVILREEAGLMPIYSALIGSARETPTPDVKWQVDEVVGARTAINNGGAAYDGATTSLVVDSVAGIGVGYLVLCEATRELLRVTAVNTGTNTLTVVRSVGGIAAASASVADNAALKAIGYAAGEGSTSPVAVGSLPSIVTNYITTHRKAIKVTGLADATRVKTEMPRAYQRRKKLVEVTQDIERNFLFGQKSIDNSDADGNRVWTSDGLYAAIATNVVNVSGNLTEATLLSALNQFTAYGSQSKIVFAGPTMMEYIARIFSGRLRLARLSDGVNLSATVVEAFGSRFSFVTHRGLSGTFAADGVVVDPTEASIRYMAGGRGRLHLKEDVIKDGTDAVTDEWMAELCLQYGDEKSHGRITGVTGVA